MSDVAGEGAGRAGVVARRRVFLLPGYEPMGPNAHHRRFVREIRRCEKTWGFSAVVGEIDQPEGEPPRFSVTAEGPDWRTDSEIVLLAWDDLIAEDRAKGFARKLADYLVAAADVVASGAFLRYARAYWRYALFAGYPAFLILAALGLGAAGAGALAALGVLEGALGVAAAAAIAYLLIAGLGPRVHLDTMMDDWTFARAMIRRSRPAIEARYSAFADTILGDRSRDVAGGKPDETVVLAHSLGAAWMVEAVARALDKAPDLARGGAPIGLVGVGSSVLKIALHPAAGWLRDSVKRVADEPAILWAEYDSHVDFIAFYKNNSVEALGLSAASKPVARSIRLSRMLAPETWARFRLDLLRVHRQYVMGNERRYLYDFHLIATGPFPLRRIVHDGETLPAALQADGALAAAPSEEVPRP